MNTTNCPHRKNGNVLTCKLCKGGKHSAAVQLGRLGGKARAARMSETELSEAGRKAASSPRPRCVCGHGKANHYATDGLCYYSVCSCLKFTPRPSRRKAKVGT